MKRKDVVKKYEGGKHRKKKERKKKRWG